MRLLDAALNFTPASSDGSLLLLGATLRVSCFLLAAVFLGFLLRQRAAAVRHRVWALALVGTLVVPAAWAFAPAWQLPILPSEAAVARDPAFGAGPNLLTRRISPPQNDARTVSDPLSAAEDLEDPKIDLAAMPPLTGDYPRGSAAANQRPTSRGLPASSERMNRFVALLRSANWKFWIPAIWAAGTIVQLIWLLVGIAAALRVIRGSTPVIDSTWLAELADQCAKTGTLRRVALCATARSMSPMAWGRWSPRIVLPTDYLGWSAERRRSVLLHELAHIRRHDWSWQLLASVAGCAWWFHPLAWFAARQLRKASEQAADDFVIYSGEPATRYAEELLAIAAGLHSSLNLGPAQAMFRGSQLESRLSAILDTRRCRDALSRRASFASLLVAAALVSLVAVLTPAKIRAEVQAEARPAVKAQGTVPSTTSPVGPVARREPILPAAGKTIGGTIIDVRGQGVAEATILIIPATESHVTHPVYDRVRVGKSDATGRWRCELVADDMPGALVRVMHRDFRVTDLDLNKHRASLSDFTNVIAPRNAYGKVTGRVLDPDGAPVHRATISCDANHVQDVNHVQSEADGRFELPHCALGLNTLAIYADGYEPKSERVTVADGTPPIDVRLKAGATIRLRLKNPRGEPIPGAIVSLRPVGSNRNFHTGLNADSSGFYATNSATHGESLLGCRADGYMSLYDFAIRPSEAEQPITLYPQFTLKGQVTDAETAEPVYEFAVLTPATSAAATARQPRQQGDRGRYEVEFTQAQPRYQLRIEAPGYQPAESEPIEPENPPKTLDFKLVRLPKLSGAVHLPDGSPVDRAMLIAVAGSHAKLPIMGDLVAMHPNCYSQADGSFSLGKLDEPFLLIARHENGYGELVIDQSTGVASIILQPWARVEGTINGKTSLAEEIYFLRRVKSNSLDVLCDFCAIRTKIDDEGHFTLDRVVPGEGYLTCRNSLVPSGYPSPGNSYRNVAVTFEAGKTARVTIGGAGRTVIGRAIAPQQLGESYDWSANDLARIVPVSQSQDQAPSQKPFDLRADFMLKADGTFRVDDIPIGTHRLTIPLAPWRLRSLGAQPIGETILEFTIPAIPPGDGDTPFDLGDIQVALVPQLEIGDVAPALNLETLEGREFDLPGYRGKVVLLNFWTTWSPACLQQLPNLQEVYRRFGGNPNFAMCGISLNGGEAKERVQTIAQELAWPQAAAPGGLGGPFARSYVVRDVPAMILIGPDGKVLDKFTTVSAALNSAIEAPLDKQAQSQH